MLRIIATISVVLMHANWSFYSDSYTEFHPSTEWIIETLINVVTRFSVPVFVMLSGAFNLCNNTNSIQFYKKTSFKIFLPTLVVIIILIPVAFLMCRLYGTSTVDMLKNLITGGFYNLWYMYMLFILYLLTPMILLIKQSVNFKQYSFIAFLMIIWSIVSQATSSQKLAYSIGVVVSFVGYYMLGDIIFSHVQESQHTTKKYMILIAIILVSVFCGYIARSHGFNYYSFQPYVSFFSPTIVTLSCALFYLFGMISVNKSFQWLSSKTFYIYLFHTVILKVLDKTIHFRSACGILFLTIGTLTISLLAAILFDKIWMLIVKKFHLSTIWNSMRVWKMIEH